MAETKINVLPMEVANLIAAGEVVDRPASVLKELLENAIDAGSTAVTAEIKQGGIAYIRVSDNGCGMAAADLPLALKRHATSKIREASDLSGILTLGFRGEALAAISSVARVRIMSRERTAETGTLLCSEYGNVTEVREAGCPVGTTVIVEELFSNLPARRKFLKKDITEAMAVAATVEKVALSRPDVSVKLIIDGTLKFATSGDGDLKNAIYALMGRDFAAKLIPVNAKNGAIGICGFIGRSDNIRGNRNFQNFFINGRYIRSRTASAALEQAYTSFIAPEKFPCCVLTIEIDPSLVDVNVHPAKLEVKFSDERAVFEAVYYAVRDALENSTEKPELKMPQSGNRVARDYSRELNRGNAQNAFTSATAKGEQLSFGAGSTPAPNTSEKKSGHAEIPRPRADFFEHINLRDNAARSDTTHEVGIGIGLPKLHNVGLASGIGIPERYPAKEEQRGGEKENAFVFSAAEAPGIEASLPSSGITPPGATAKTEEPVSAGVQQPAAPASDRGDRQMQTLPDYVIVGVAFNCYIIVQIGEKLLIIDKHAAHERILFEELNARRAQADPAAQCLLVPIRVGVSTEEAAALEEYRHEILDTGFDFGLDHAGHAALIRQIPKGIRIAVAGDAFLAMAQRLAEGTGNAALTRDLLYEKALYQTACKAAIKGGQEDTPENIDWIVRQVLRMPDITVCPHGRPIAAELTHAYLDRQFERER